MASLTTCESHDGVVIVYNYGSAIRECPLCKADETIGNLEAKIENLDQEIDSLKDEVLEAKNNG